MEEQHYSETELVPKLFVEKTCKTSAKTVPHIKKVVVHYFCLSLTTLNARCPSVGM